MTTSDRARPTARLRRWILVVALTLAAAVLAVAIGGLVDDRSSSATPAAEPPQLADGTTGTAPDSDPEAARQDGSRGADGSLPDGATVFDDAPAVTGLDPALLEALRRAATDAAVDGVTFEVNSGWRSPEYQERLLSDAVAEYGSAEEAARWVATAETSPHVRGEAADIGGWDATDWLVQHGAAYGLCPIYANEPWHYELRPDAVDDGCPAMYADPTEDPRMQR